MTTATETAAPARAQQATHFFVITVEVDRKPVTVSGGVTPGEGQTRQELFDQICTQVIDGFPNYKQLPVLLFSVDRNTL